MGGSKQVQPQFLVPPDVGSLRPQYSNFLSALMGGGAQGLQYGGQLNAPTDPLQATALQQFTGLLTGQGPRSPFTSAYRTLGEAVETGLPVDTTALAQQARGTFTNTIAPAIQERLGGQYGIRFGTPVSEQLSRAGAEVATNLNAQLLPFAEAAQQRRLGASQLAGGLAGQGFDIGSRFFGQQQGALDRQAGEFQRAQQLLFSTLQGGVGTLSGTGQFQQPQFQQSTLQQLIPIFAALLGGAFGGAPGAALGGAAGRYLTV